MILLRIEIAALTLWLGLVRIPLVRLGARLGARLQRRSA